MKTLLALFTIYPFASALAAEKTSCFDREEQKLISSNPKVVKRSDKSPSSLIFKLKNGKDLILTDKLPRCTDNEQKKNHTLTELSPEGNWAVVEVSGWEVSSKDLYYLPTGKAIPLDESGVSWSPDGSMVIIYSENTCAKPDPECSEVARGEIYKCDGKDCLKVWRLEENLVRHLILPGETIKGISTAFWSKASVTATLVSENHKKKTETSIVCGEFKPGTWGCTKD